MKSKSEQKFYDILYEKNWDGDYSLQPFRNMRYHFFLRELENLKIDIKNAKILDYGCGNCYLVNFLIEKYNLNPENFYGYDISKKAIEIAKNKHKGSYL